MHKEWWHKAQAAQYQGCRKHLNGHRWNRVVYLRIQRQQGTAVEEKKRKAEKEENALEIALPTVAKNYNHPEELQQRSKGVADEANVEERTQSSSPASDSTVTCTAEQLPSARFFLH